MLKYSSAAYTEGRMISGGSSGCWMYKRYLVNTYLVREAGHGAEIRNLYARHLELCGLSLGRDCLEETRSFYTDL